MAQAGAGFRRRDAEHAEADGILAEAAVEDEERALKGFRLSTAREGVPVKAVDPLEQGRKLQQVELKIDVLNFAVRAAPHQFGVSQVHADFPAVGGGAAIEADTADVGERLEQFGDLADQVGNPLRSRITAGMGPQVAGFDFLEQMFQRQVRMTHEASNSRLVIWKTIVHPVGQASRLPGKSCVTLRRASGTLSLRYRETTRGGLTSIDTPPHPSTIAISRRLESRLQPVGRVKAELQRLAESFEVDEAIRKADVLIEAMSWIRRFRDRIVVIKLGGSALEDPQTVRNLLTDVIFMETVGMRPVLVHGGGKAINAAMKDAGLELQFVRGRRYTDAATLDIVAHVLAGEICADIVRQIEEQGGKASGLSYLTENCLIGEKLLLPQAEGDPLDLGFVGQVVNIDRRLILDTCAAGIIPVIPSIAVDVTGQRYNVNADTAAAAVARMLEAEKLIFLSDVPGIFLDRTDPNTLVSHLETARCRELIANGTIDAGMVPKVDAALDALDAGVKKVHIVDGRMPHSLLYEVYSDRGIGTEIVT